MSLRLAGACVVAAVAVVLASARPTARQTPIIVDHDSVILFDDIPSGYKTAAAAMTMMFLDRSVGDNVWTGLNCLTMTMDDPSLPNGCDNWGANPPEEWTGTWDSTNWIYFGEPDVGLPNPITCTTSDGLWTGLQPCWMEFLQAGSELDNWDVVSFECSYFCALGAQTPVDYFTPSGSYSDINDWASFVSGIAPKQAMFWTTSLVSDDVADATMLEDLAGYNNAARSYIAGTSYLLLDLADIESHDMSGNACFDDGTEALCSVYTTDNGHLGPGQGKIRLAKAVWVAMAQLAGWEPSAEGATPIPMPLRRVKGNNAPMLR